MVGFSHKPYHAGGNHGGLYAITKDSGKIFHHKESIFHGTLHRPIEKQSDRQDRSEILSVRLNPAFGLCISGDDHHLDQYYTIDYGDRGTRNLISLNISLVGDQSPIHHFYNPVSIQLMIQKKV
jgi:hypothetical protein